MNSLTLRRPRIATSLVMMFSAFAIIVSAFAYMTVHGLSDLHKGSHEISRTALPNILVAKDIKSDMLAIQGAYFAYITGSNRPS